MQFPEQEWSFCDQFRQPGVIIQLTSGLLLNWKRIIFLDTAFFPFLQELEQIEESWRKETKDLYENVAHLQEENRKLQKAAVEHEGNTVKYKGKFTLINRI